MKVAIDKNCIAKVKDFTEYEYIYLYDKEPLKELLNLKLHCANKDFLDEVDINLSSYEIKCFKKANIKDKDWNKMPVIKDKKIGIIVPNYNYEHTIEKCLNSIAEQTYRNFEVVFVDDCSTDNSVKIAETFKDKMNIKIVQLKQKRLNGGARNEAYLHLSNDVDYVYYVDSDDWLYSNQVLEKINKALRTSPDVLFVGLASYRKQKTSTCYIPQYKNKYDAIVGWSGSCGKVIKKELAVRPECLYNEGTLKEDRTQHRKICIYMNTFNILAEPCYVWNQENTKSVTTIREKTIWGTSTIRHYADTLQLYLSEKGKDKVIDRILEEAVQKTRNEAYNGGDKQW